MKTTKKTITVKINLSFYPSKYDQTKNMYSGGVAIPRFLKELVIDVYEDQEFDEKVDDFVNNGKYGVVITGSDRALAEFGKYLIGVSKYKTLDPDYHDHFDGIKNLEGKGLVNLIVKKCSNLKKHSDNTMR